MVPGSREVSSQLKDCTPLSYENRKALLDAVSKQEWLLSSTELCADCWVANVELGFNCAMTQF